MLSEALTCAATVYCLDSQVCSKFGIVEPRFINFGVVNLIFINKMVYNNKNFKVWIKFGFLTVS